jgi:hypothetical protein
MAEKPLTQPLDRSFNADSGPRLAKERSEPVQIVIFRPEPQSPAQSFLSSHPTWYPHPVEPDPNAKAVGELTEAAADRTLAKAVGVAAGAVVGGAGVWTGLGPFAAVPAALTKNVVEGLAGRLSSDPSTERMLEAARSLPNYGTVDVSCTIADLDIKAIMPRKRAGANLKPQIVDGEYSRWHVELR